MRIVPRATRPTGALPPAPESARGVKKPTSVGQGLPELAISLAPSGESLPSAGEVSRKATERYLDALASVDQDTTLEDVLLRLGQPTYWHGRRVRALQPFAPDDRQLMQAT